LVKFEGSSSCRLALSRGVVAHDERADAAAKADDDGSGRWASTAAAAASARAEAAAMQSRTGALVRGDECGARPLEAK
jgi:hypothetical protein